MHLGRQFSGLRSFIANGVESLWESLKPSSLILKRNIQGWKCLARIKCKKCGAIFEYEYKPFESLAHLGPYKMVKCPACGKSSFINVFSNVKDPVNYPSQTKKPDEQTGQPLLEEDQEKKRIEESKYEKT